MAVIIYKSRAVPEEGIESKGVGSVLELRAKMPLAKERRSILVFFKQPGNGDLIEIHI